MWRRAQDRAAQRGGGEQAGTAVLRERVRRERDVALETVEDVGRLLNRLRRRVRLGRPAAPTASVVDILRPKTAGDLASGRWRALGDAMAALDRLQRQADGWARIPRPAKDSMPPRVILAEWVGLRLAAAGVPLMKSRAGYFASVLEAVYEHAGEPVATVVRDIGRVIDDAALWQALGLVPQPKGTKRRRSFSAFVPSA